jgi:hypothetical protein
VTKRKPSHMVRAVTSVPSRTINFSFECKNLAGDPFALENVKDGILRELVKKMQYYGTIEPKHLRNYDHHCHPIDWKDPRPIRTGFIHLDEQKQAYPAWQLSTVFHKFGRSLT